MGYWILWTHNNNFRSCIFSWPTTVSSRKKLKNNKYSYTKKLCWVKSIHSAFFVFSEFYIVISDWKFVRPEHFFGFLMIHIQSVFPYCKGSPFLQIRLDWFLLISTKTDVILDLLFFVDDAEKIHREWMNRIDSRMPFRFASFFSPFLGPLIDLRPVFT
jgi:hypothetical protein